MSQQQILNCLQHGELVSVMARQCPPELYWALEYFFPQSTMRMSDKGVFNILEMIEDSVEPAQFAALCAIKGNVVSSGQSIDLKQVKAPRIFEENHIAACDIDDTLINTMTGEPLMGHAAKLDYAQALNMRRQMIRLRKRLNLMVFEQIVDGTLTIDGENIDKTVIDFGRDPNNTVILTDPNDKWCSATPNESPLDQLDAIVDSVFECESGVVDVLWKNSTTTKAFRNHKAIVDMLKAKGDSKCEQCLLNINDQPKGTLVKGQKLIAEINGYRFWEVGNRTVGAELMNEEDIYLVIRDEARPIRGYGALSDMRAPGGVVREPMLMTQELKKHGIKWKFESRPLPFFANINATAVVKGVVGC